MSDPAAPSPVPVSLPEKGDPDQRLERASKIANIFTPVLLALVAGLYTLQKDCSENRNRDAQVVRETEARNIQAQRDEDQRNWDRKQKQYSNFSVLMPLLTSEKSSEVDAGLKIYTAEAADGVAPTSLQLLIDDLKARHPDLKQAAEQAFNAGQSQIQREACKQLPDGLYIHVANSSDQLQRGRKLANLLMAAGVPVQGVQRIDAGPSNTTLKWYRGSTTDPVAEKIDSALVNLGFPRPAAIDLTQQYLKKGCAAPGIYELWIGSSTPLGEDGKGQ